MKLFYLMAIALIVIIGLSFCEHRVYSHGGERIAIYNLSGLVNKMVLQLDTLVATMDECIVNNRKDK